MYFLVLALTRTPPLLPSLFHTHAQSNGEIVLAGASSGIFLSTDYGANFFTVPDALGSEGSDYQVTMSADGSTLVAVGSLIAPWVSVDGGVTWQQSDSAYALDWVDVECSSDCAVLVAPTGQEYVYLSHDLGQMWNSTGSTGSWSSVAISRTAIPSSWAST